jgi:predicted MFS family arabinose efflux permease
LLTNCSFVTHTAGSAGLIYITKMMTGAKAGLAGGLYGTFIQLGFSLGPSVGTIGLRESAMGQVSYATVLIALIRFSGYIAEKNARRQGTNTGQSSYDEPSFPTSSYLYGLQCASWILAALSLFGESEI